MDQKSRSLTSGTPAFSTPSHAPQECGASINNHQTSSYGQILRSSSIIGGATGINYLIGMVRTKTVVVKRPSLPS